MVTASIVTYEHHLLDIEPVLRSLFASPVDVVYIVDHSPNPTFLLPELQEFVQRVLNGEPMLKVKVQNGFRMEYFVHENNGYGGGHNYAIRMAQKVGSQFHLVVNPDIWFGPEVLPKLIAYMVCHPDVGQMMPKVLYPDGSIQRLAKLLPTPLDLFGRLCLPWFLVERRNRRFELTKSNFVMTLNVPYLSGCFMFFRMEDLIEIGMFDEEHFFMYAEDVDITRRMHLNHKTLYYPETTIYHKFSRASRRSLWLFWVHTVNMIKYFNKWGWFRDEQRTRWNREVVKEIARQL